MNEFGVLLRSVCIITEIPISYISFVATSIDTSVNVYVLRTENGCSACLMRKRVNKSGRMSL